MAGALAGLMAAALVVGLLVGSWRIANRKGRSSRLSAAGANWLGELNEIFNPQQTNVEQLARLKEESAEEEDEGDDDEPPELLALGGGAHPDDGLRMRGVPPQARSPEP